MKTKENLIKEVCRDSIAEELGIQPGDVMLNINGKAVLDVFDYKFLIADEYIEMLIRKQDGEEWLLEIEKDEYEDIGLVFENSLMDRVSGCGNKCIFCFIDQLPKGMRNTLYFKDDDSRLSFFQGNYVTLTNMSKKDIERIIYYHMSPINISVHVTDPKLREEILGNKKAGNVLEYIEMLNKSGIDINGQVVLLKGINDGEILRKTISELAAYDSVKSLSVVPVGLTKHRKGLTPLLPIEKEDAIKAVKEIEGFWDRFLKDKGSRLVFASDELYLTAEMELPPFEAYEDFYQLENGVGMMRLFEKEFNDAFEKVKPEIFEQNIHIATGKSAYPFMKGFAERIMGKMKNAEINTHLIENNFFGRSITVSGLLTGTDIINSLKGKIKDGVLLIPENALRSGEDVLLDDLRLSDIEDALSVKVASVPVDGGAFLDVILKSGRNKWEKTQKQ